MAIDDEIGKIERREMREVMAQEAENIIQQLPILAQLYWQAFVELKKAGFTDQQALDIVQKKGWNLAS